MRSMGFEPLASYSTVQSDQPDELTHFVYFGFRKMNCSNSSLEAMSTPNSTGETAPPASADVFIILLKTVATGLLMMVSLIGNTLVVCVVFQSLRMRTVTNYLIVNMACADFLYTLVAGPPLVIMILEEENWAMGSRGRGIYFCQVVNVAQYILIPVSLLTLAAIAFDRFFAILIPLKRIITKRVFNWILLAIWMTSAAIGAPMIYSLRIDIFEGELRCYEEWTPAFDDESAKRIYTIVSFAVVFCFPLFIITVLYTIICRHLWFMKMPGEIGQEESHNFIKHRNSRRKVVKMLIAVVVVFLASWLPLSVANLLLYFSTDTYIPDSVYFTCLFLMRASCALNPAVYAIFSENYRQGFKRVLARCSCFKISGLNPQRSSSTSRNQTVPSFSRNEQLLPRRTTCKKSLRQGTEAEGENRV